MPLHWPSWFSPSFDWLQVEVSSCCNAACTYCPHTLYRDTWQSRLMPVETFRRLSSVFAKTELVYLQGWGEPLLHPQFFEFVRIAKDAGCRVGVTTNGMLLDEEKCRRLVDAGLDVIAFSLAGVDEQNDIIRKGTRLEHVFEMIRVLNDIKRSDRAAFDIHIAYMLLRSQLDSIHLLPELLQDLGIHQVVISVLDFVGDPVLASECLVPQSEDEYQALRSKLDAVAAAGRARGMDVHYWLAAPGQDCAAEAQTAAETDLALAMFLPQPDRCPENIHRAAFVSADGEVSCCTYMNIPVSAASFVVDCTELPYQRTTFGNGQTAPLDAIWRAKVYRLFRARHQRGDWPPFCRLCPRRRMTGASN